MGAIRLTNVLHLRDPRTGVEGQEFRFRLGPGAAGLDGVGDPVAWRLSTDLIPTAAEQGSAERLRRHSLGRSAAPFSAVDAERGHRWGAAHGRKLLWKFRRS